MPKPMDTQIIKNTFIIQVWDNLKEYNDKMGWVDIGSYNDLNKAIKERLRILKENEERQESWKTRIVYESTVRISIVED